MLDVTRYTCPICQKPFEKSDDVVFCPQCGAPHHRACYRRQGACAFAEKHGTPAQWKPLPLKDSDGTVVCGNCGTVNEEDQTVCVKCGHILEEVFPPSPSEQQPPVDESVFYAQFSPYIGIAPDSTMDDFPVMDIATFVGPNSGFYLSRFHFMRLGKNKMSWNWAAAICPLLWALYRKMYRLFWILLAVSAVLYIPLICAVVDILGKISGDPAAMRQLAQGILPDISLPMGLIIAVNVASTGRFLLRAVMASLGNHFYHAYTVRHMKKIRASLADELPYRFALSQKGGVSLVKPIVFVVSLFLLSLGALVLWLLVA